MKKIIYTRPDDGGLSVVNPAEGARLAFSVALADGTRHGPDGRVIAEGDVVGAIPVDRILRSWPVDGAVAEWAETEAEFVARIAAKDVPLGARDVQIVDASAIPTDRSFRDAWKAGPGRVEHDMEKCREIHKDRLRAMRKPKLAALDVAYQRAIESGAPAPEITKIVQQKQVLRDVTADPRISAATTPEELKLAVPNTF